MTKLLAKAIDRAKVTYTEQQIRFALIDFYREAIRDALQATLRHSCDNRHDLCHCKEHIASVIRKLSDEE